MKKIDALSYGKFTFGDKILLPVDTPESMGLETGDIIIFHFRPDVKDRLDAERQEKEDLKRKEEIKRLLETEREEMELEREEKAREIVRENEQEERMNRCEKERLALSLFFGENDEASATNTDSEFDLISTEALKSFILNKRNWMNDEHYQRVMSYFVDDIFIHRNPHLLEVVTYLSTYICFIFKKNKDDYNPMKHMRVLLKTFFQNDDNEKQCFSVLQMMSAEIKRLQKVYRTSNASARFETVVERVGIGHAKDVNATFGDQGISHMTLAYILDNKQMIGYLYNHGGKITTVLEFFEVNFLKNNPKLNTPALRLMVLMYIAIEIYEVGIRWISPVNDEELIADFDAMKPPSSQDNEKKKRIEKPVPAPSIAIATDSEEVEEDDENDYSVFAKKPQVIKQVKKKASVKPVVKVEKPVVRVEKPVVKPLMKIVQPAVKPVVKILVKPPVKKVDVKPPISPRATKFALLLQQQELPRPPFLGLQYVSPERIRYAIDSVCYFKHY